MLLRNGREDPRERRDIAMAEGYWVFHPLYKIIDEFQASLKRESPIPVGTPDPYVPKAN